MELRIKHNKNYATVYFAPISASGLITAWRQRDQNYKHGFVVRVLWLGLVVRWGYERQLSLHDLLAEIVDEALFH